MQKDNHILNFLKNLLYPLILEFVIVFLILVTTLSLEFKSRQIFNSGVFEVIIVRSTGLTLLYLLIFKVLKSGILFILNFATSFSKRQAAEKFDPLNILSDIFITLYIILLSSPVRPILQKVYTNGETTTFDEGFAKFDAIPTVGILLVAGVPLFILIMIRIKGFYKWFAAAILASVIAFAGYYNNKPNYNARIFETRANWIIRDWEQQGIDAKIALDSAETNQEKATAYYWLGVSANRQGRYEEALEYQKKAIDVMPEYGPPYSSASLASLFLGDYISAKSYADECVLRDPNYAWCHYAMGAYFDHTGERKDAYNSLEKAVNLDPNSNELRDIFERFKINNPGIEE